jgi:hypothetical protein
MRRNIERPRARQQAVISGQGIRRRRYDRGQDEHFARHSTRIRELRAAKQMASHLNAQPD